MKILAWIVGVPVAALILMVLIGFMLPEPSAEEKIRRSAKNAYSLCRDEIDKSAHPDLMRQMCAGMRGDYMRKYQAEP